MTPHLEEAFIKLVDRYELLVGETPSVSDIADLVPNSDPRQWLSVALDKHLAAEREKLRTLLGQIECLNNTMQQNTPRLMAKWKNHEKLDNLLHEVYVILGE